MCLKNAILLTGLPGAGKSTIVKNVIEALEAEGVIKRGDIFGYKTIRLLDNAGRLEGFKIVTYGGQKCMLAAVKQKTAYRYMGLYVNRSAFDDTITAEFDRVKNSLHPLICLDEIGLMEKVSAQYMARVIDLFQNFCHPVIAVIKLIDEDDFLDRIKGLDNVELYMVDKSVRLAVEEKVYARLRALVKRV